MLTITTGWEWSIEKLSFEMGGISVGFEGRWGEKSVKLMFAHERRWCRVFVPT